MAMAYDAPAPFKPVSMIKTLLTISRIAAVAKMCHRHLTRFACKHQKLYSIRESDLCKTAVSRGRQQCAPENFLSNELLDDQPCDKCKDEDGPWNASEDTKACEVDQKEESIRRVQQDLDTDRLIARVDYMLATGKPAPKAPAHVLRTAKD